MKDACIVGATEGRVVGLEEGLGRWLTYRSSGDGRESDKKDELTVVGKMAEKWVGERASRKARLRRWTSARFGR